MKEDIGYTVSSENIYADFGLPNADRLLLKSNLAIEVCRVIRLNHLTQRKVSEITGVPQAHVSRLLNGDFQIFSSDRLEKMLNGLGGRLILDFYSQINLDAWSESGHDVVLSEKTVDEFCDRDYVGLSIQPHGCEELPEAA